MFYFVRPITGWEAAHPSAARFQIVLGTQSVETCGAAPGPEDIAENLCEEPLSVCGSLNAQTTRMIRPLQICHCPLSFV